MLILGVLILIVFIGGVGGLAKAANRPVKSGRASTGGRSRASRSAGGSTGRSAGRAGGPGSRSGGATRSGGGSGRSYQSGRRSGGFGAWVTKAWNASGAPKTSESTLSGASAVVTGKAAGAVSRGGWRVSKKTGRAGRWFAARAMVPFDKWLERKHAGLESAAAFAGDNPQPQPAESTPDDGLSWRQRHEREQKYKRYAELRHKSGSDLTVAQLINEVDVDHDEAEELARLFSARFRRENTNPNTSGTTPRPRVGRNVTMAGATGNVGVPPTLATHIDALNGAEFEDDADYLNWLAGEVAGALAYAEALAHIHDRALNGEGLDPQAIRGLADLSDAKTEFAARAKGAHAEFNEVYNAVIGFVQDGGKLPNNGRWITGESAA